MSDLRDDLSDTDSSVTDPLDTRDDDGWEDLEDDEIPVKVVSLFDDATYPNALDMLHYCKQHHGFDIWQLQREQDLDFLDLVRLVNYIRSEVKAGNTRPDTKSKTLFEADKYLKPVLEDDALLYSLDDVMQEDGQNAARTEVEQLREQLQSLQLQFSAYREEVQKVLNQKLDSDDLNATGSGSTLSSRSAEALPAKPKDPMFDADYFKSYSYNTIHESMLKDKIRTDSYRDFIYDNKHLFEGKIVLDVGCGTGILSMFAAKAGAQLVIAVDNSDIIDKARQIVFENGLQDKIKCLRGKIEEVTLPVPKVDIIVSEWMGYCLLYESMLDSVLNARDKYLAPGGLMVPSHAAIHVAPLADSELRTSHIDFWKDVYGFDMTGMLERAHEEALVRIIDDKELASGSQAVLQLDLHSAKIEDLMFTGNFEFKCREGVELLDGFAIWFDMVFMPSSSTSTQAPLSVIAAKKREIVAFSTGPSSEPTHWQQGVFLIKDPKDILQEGITVNGHVKYEKKTGQERSLDIEIAWTLPGAAQKKSQIWFLD